MKYLRWLLPVMLAVFVHAEARSQLRLPPPPPPPGFGGPVRGIGIGFGYSGRRLAISGYLGQNAYGLGYPLGVSYRNVNITILTPPSPVIVSPPIVINNNTVVNNPPATPDDRVAREQMEDERFLRIAPRKPAGGPEAVPVPAPKEKAMPGEPAGGFRPVRPEERIRPDAPAMRRPAEMPAPRRPAIAEQPADNPKEENARQVALGKQAFAAQEYGRAERRFLQAVRVDAREPQAYFLLAQAQFALGKYREAVESIGAGMHHKPDWPGARFALEDLYGGNGDDLKEQLKHLEDVLDKNPNDFSLLFLNAYELWFTGKQAAARLLFNRALRVAPDNLKPLINRFLVHGVPVAIDR